jgi:hypothetical protein
MQDSRQFHVQIVPMREPGDLAPLDELTHT